MSATRRSVHDPPANHYDAVQHKFREPPLEYANFPACRITAPFQMCIIGGTGSGKTNGLIEVFQSMNCFTKVMLYVKDPSEMLYKDWIDRLKKAEKRLGQEIVVVDDKLDSLPEVKDLKKEGQHTLVVFDDMMSEKDRMLARVVPYFSMGRKEGVSAVFISQNFYAVPQSIRQNAGIVLLYRINMGRNMAMISRELKGADKTEEELQEMYRHVQSLGFPHFLMIDAQNPDPRFKYRVNFAPLLMPGQGGEVEEVKSGEEEKDHEQVKSRVVVLKKKKRRPAPSSTKGEYGEANKVRAIVGGTVNLKRPPVHLAPAKPFW
jgi:Poxvirus A32 protein